jgi:hypothetical protein
MNLPNLQDVISFRSQHGEHVRIGSTTITPVSRALVVNLPFIGLVWNRPTGVIVETSDSRRRVRIHDHTRLMQLGLGIVALGLIAAVMPKWNSNRGEQ